MKLFRIFFLATIGLFAADLTYACGNEYEPVIPVTNAEGKVIEVDLYSFGLFSHGFDEEILSQRKQKIQNKITNNEADYKDYSDLALIELKIGNKDYAIRTLDSLYKLYPNEYNIVANLGTGYELIGENKKALKFIRKAVRLNADSHNGSEWIHVEILKQKLKSKPDYASIIKTNFKGPLSEVYNNMKEEKKSYWRGIGYALAFQLKERIAFIAPEDVCVGQLLYDLAEIKAVTSSLDEAKIDYELALEYNPALKPKIDTRLKEINKKIYWNAFVDIIPFLFIVLLVVVFSYVVVRTLVKTGVLNLGVITVLYFIQLLVFLPLFKLYSYFSQEVSSPVYLLWDIVNLIAGLICFFALLRKNTPTLLYKLQTVQCLVIVVLLGIGFAVFETPILIALAVVFSLGILLTHFLVRFSLRKNSLLPQEAAKTNIPV